VGREDGTRRLASRGNGLRQLRLAGVRCAIIIDVTRNNWFRKRFNPAVPRDVGHISIRGEGGQL
jgi:hypothetical protein